jgi:hypothetical protein
VKVPEFRLWPSGVASRLSNGYGHGTIKMKGGFVEIALDWERDGVTQAGAQCLASTAQPLPQRLLPNKRLWRNTSVVCCLIPTVPLHPAHGTRSHSKDTKIAGYSTVNTPQRAPARLSTSLISLSPHLHPYLHHPCKVRYACFLHGAALDGDKNMLDAFLPVKSRAIPTTLLGTMVLEDYPPL